MQNGANLRGSGYSTQSALIVPCPNKPNLYYLFTIRNYSETGDDGLNGGLYYSIVNMELNQRLGDLQLDKKNVLVERFTTEKLIAVPHRNQRDYWIISHAYNSNEFLVYLLTFEGLSSAKRIPIGTIHKGGPATGSEAKGYLKASPNGRMLAAAVYGVNRPFELYDFNNQDGTISNYRSLGDFTAQYGVSFSPDNTKLYLSEIYQFGLVSSSNASSYQFDLSQQPYQVVRLPIADSLKSTTFTRYINGGLQLGIDGRLYAATAESGRLAIIEHPNELGMSCQPHYVDFDFGEGRSGIGLPNFLQNIFNITTIDAHTDSSQVCQNYLSVYPNPITSNILTIQQFSSDCPSMDLSVYDVTGRLINHYSSLNGRSVIDVNGWPAGVYMLVFNFDKKRVVKKVVKR